ncbi:MAG: hypothetical protein FWG38_08160 [Defluviitaleaceae bacterium]|nr:hypothetical protein [Defluviitaleaceae bacterium]
MSRKWLCMLGILAVIAMLAACGSSAPAVEESTASEAEVAGGRGGRTAAPEVSLVGLWEYDHGSFIYYFASGSDIVFFEDGTVMEYAFGEPGQYTMLADGRMNVVGNWGDNSYVYTVQLTADRLTITDRDGDSGVWRRASATANANNADKDVPAPAPTVNSRDLVGLWEYNNGSAIYYFMRSDQIEFFANGDVMEYAFGEPGTYTVLADGRLSVVSGWSGNTNEFTIELNGDTLTITDRDGDRGVWRRASNAGAAIDSALVGRWEYVDGSFIYYFASGDDIEFFADGRVKEHAFGEAGQLAVLANGRLRVVGEWGDNAYIFSYELFDNMLTITDSDGDRGTWVRAGTSIASADMDSDLVGRWEYVEGSFIYYFASGDDIEFFADGRVKEHAFGEPGRLTMLGEGRIRVNGEWDSSAYDFTYRMDGDKITITDRDGDHGTWRKVS